MSGEGDHNSGEQGGQQPQGGQQGNGQPQGGQPQGGQPAQGSQPDGGQPAPGGQPTSGQPAQGGQARGQGYQQPGLGDKLQQPAVKSQIVKGIGLFGAIGVGLLLTAFVPEVIDDTYGTQFTDATGSIALGIGPVVAVLTGREFGRLTVEQNTALAGSYLTGTGGYFVLALLGLVGLEISDSGLGRSGLGDLLLPLIFAALMVGVAGVAATYVERNY